MRYRDIRRVKALPVFARNQKRLHHVCPAEVAAELVQFA
jgi:hypothetical protein